MHQFPRELFVGKITALPFYHFGSILPLMRINKYLALHDYATRKGGDELVAKGLVFVNGKKAKLGDQVEETDNVEVRMNTHIKYAYYAYNKPIGVITHSPQRGEKDIKQDVEHFADLRGIFPVGRLDKDSHGLMILTNDGRITDKLLNPERNHEKEYKVRTQLKLRDSFKKYMEAGVDIDGYVTKKCKVKVTGEFTFFITLGEGKKHQIRRMVAALHNAVEDLERVRILNIKLGELKRGEYRKLEGAELKLFLKTVGMN
jgi:23S rRNA pseudouridine2604 synthase